MTKNCANIYIIYFQIFNDENLPQTPHKKNGRSLAKIF